MHASCMASTQQQHLYCMLCLPFSSSREHLSEVWLLAQQNSLRLRRSLTTKLLHLRLTDNLVCENRKHTWTLFLLKVPNVLFCNPSKILSIFPKYSVPARIAATPYTLLCMPFHGHPLRLLRSPLEAASISPNPTGVTPYTAAMQGSPSAICLSPASLVASGSFQTESWQAAQGPATLGLTLEVLRILSLLCCLRCCQQAKAAILQVVPIMAQTMLMLAYASSSWHWALSTTITPFTSVQSCSCTGAPTPAMPLWAKATVYTLSGRQAIQRPCGKQ